MIVLLFFIAAVVIVVGFIGKFTANDEENWLV
jgi:hypothetical protein